MKKQNRNDKNKIFIVLLLMSVFFLWGCGGNDNVEEPQGEGPAPVETPVSQEPESEEPEQEEVESEGSEELTEEELANLFAKGKELDEFYYEMKVTGLGDEDGITKMYMKEGLMRIESEVMGQSFMMIYSEDAFYTLDPQSKTAIKMPIGEEGNEDREVVTMDDFIEDLDDENMVYVGKETINGISCHVVESKEQNSDNQVKMWLHEEYGIPMKIETTSGSDTHVMEVTDFKTDSLSSDLFELPEGYQIIDLENLIPTP